MSGVPRWRFISSLLHHIRPDAGRLHLLDKGMALTNNLVQRDGESADWCESPVVFGRRGPLGTRKNEPAGHDEDDFRPRPWRTEHRQARSDAIRAFAHAPQAKCESLPKRLR